ncbi:MAG: MBL fold metallo-hydrolase [Actinobacteria bacterium]|nr:MBL fold metallo-hydrolase [Actinomycetota bacterium]
MDVTELAPGLWRWTAPHPDWSPEDDEGGEGWGREVGCLRLETPAALVLFDPLVPDGGAERERFWRGLDGDVERLGPPHVLLTVFWHARSSQDVLDRSAGARVWAHESVAEKVEERVRYTDTFAIGDELPAGIESVDALRADEVMYWLPEQRALVTGDVILGARDGGVRVCPDSWLPKGTSAEEFRTALRAVVLDLPVEHVLVSHGEPVLGGGRDALRRALDAQPHSGAPSAP